MVQPFRGRDCQNHHACVHPAARIQAESQRLALCTFQFNGPSGGYQLSTSYVSGQPWVPRVKQQFLWTEEELRQLWEAVSLLRMETHLQFPSSVGTFFLKDTPGWRRTQVSCLVSWEHRN